MLSTALGLGKAIAGKFLMKNAGKLVGSAIKGMKDSKYHWLNKAGDFIGSAINRVSNSNLVGGEVKKQLENATKAAKGEEVDYNLNLEDKKHKKKEEETQQPQVIQQEQPTSDVAFYNKNLGGTNFKEYKGTSKKQKHKRVKVEEHKITRERNILAN